MWLHAQILKSVKAATEVRNSVSHSAIIFANALMHCGTTVDSFLRDNLDWLSRATNWAKFSATAGLGVIHRGHLAEVNLTHFSPIFRMPILAQMEALQVPLTSGCKVESLRACICCLENGRVACALGAIALENAGWSGGSHTDWVPLDDL